jgi:hypothetical protein
MAFGIFFANQVSAASNTLNFQSKIVNVADGTNVVTGTPACVVAGSGNDTCDFRVNIYSASAAGTLYFSETHSNVEIGQYNGIFNLSINSVCASTSTAGTDGNWTSGGCVSNGGVDFSSSALWIEVAFAPGGAGSFTETFSRVQIKDVASARYAVSSSYLGGLQATDFVRFAPGSVQTTTSTNSLINLETTGNTSNPLIYADEDGAGTPDLLRLQTNDTTMFQVGNGGAVTMAGDLINSSTGTVGLFNTNVTTLNVGGAATTLNLAGGSGSTGCTINGSTGALECSGTATFNGTALQTTSSIFSLVNTTATLVNIGGAATITLAGGASSTGCTITGSTGDLDCTGTAQFDGGSIISAASTFNLINNVTTTLNIGGATTTLNLAGGVGSTGCTIDSAGALTCTGGVAATVAANSLDYDDFEDTMDLDAALTLNQAANTWTQNFTGTTTVGQTNNANSLTTGTGFAISSTATGLTSGNLASITLSGSNAANAGDLLELSVSGTLSAARGLYINNLGTGDSIRIDDVASDTTPFVIDASGNVSVGGNIATSATSIDVVNTTATTVNFAGAATTLALAGGSGSTGCTINSTGDITCTGDVTATGGDLITTSTTAAVFNTGATVAVNIAGAAATTNIGGTTVNLAGGVGSTGCTIDSAGALTCTGGVAATVSVDSLDYIDFEDTMDYDAALTVNQGGFAWTQNFTGTGNGFTYNANSVTNGFAAVINANGLTGGRGLVIDSGAGSQSGSLLYIENNAASATNTGNLAQLWVGGNLSNLKPLYITNLGVGDSMRIDDVTSDTTPFIIDNAGNMTVGGNISTSATSIDVVNTTATTVNFAGASSTTSIGGTTVNLAGGVGSTGCTIDSAGSLTCTAGIAATVAANSLDYDDFEPTMDYDTALTVNQGSLNLTHNFTGTIGDGFVYNANSLTTGTAFDLVSSATGLTGAGNLMELSMTGNSASNTGDVLQLTVGGASTLTNLLNIVNLGGGASLTISDVTADTTPFVIDSAGNVSVGADINTSATTIALLNTTATTINFGGAATTLAMAGGSGSTGCTINSSGDITCSGDVTATGGDLITTSTTAALFNTGATTLNIGGAATSMNIGPGAATAATLLFVGGSGATGCSMTGNDGAFSCTSTIAGGAFSTGGNITGNVLSGASLSVTGAVSSNSLSTGGVTATGLVNTGNAAVDYTPTALNWGSTGSTILLNALNYSTIAFHDSGARVDFIRVGTGTMTLGYDGGYGSAAISMPGQVTIGSGSPSLTSTLTARQSSVGDPVMHIINTGNASGAQGLHVQGCQNTPTAACNLIILYDGDATQAGRIQVANGGGSAYQTTSDIRSKKNITNTAYALEDLLAVQVRDYEYLDGNVRKTGYIAQELYNVYPGAVGTSEDPNEMWAVDYGSMTPLIVKGVQDLNDIVEGNTRSIADLQVRDTELLSLINGLTARVAGLETRVATLEGAQSGSGAAVDLVNFMATNGTFSGNLMVAGNTNINGKVYFGNENVGEAKILAGDTEVTIVFDTDFETMPIVQVTPQSDNFLTLPVKYVVSEKGVDKFKIKIDVAQLEDLVFNWSVSGTRDGVQIDSDGNVANL